jgi:hypothetical protein
MIVIKTVNDEIVKQEINPAHFKQFKKAGWVEFKETPIEQITEPELTEVKQTVNKGGRPKKTTNL